MKVDVQKLTEVDRNVFFLSLFLCCSDQRLKDVQFLKEELALKLEEILAETDDLVVLQSRVVKALDACKEPLRVTVLCLEERFGWEMIEETLERSKRA